jgi:C4-dicarboxylate-specific signal transduction histidine kinase
MPDKTLIIETQSLTKMANKIANLEREKKEFQAALYQSKKLEYLGQMATMMAHNMNQPLAVIRMTSSGALSNINENLFNPETEIKPILEKILNQTERLNLIMRNFRNFARGDRTVLSAVNLNQVIEDIYQLLFVAQYQLDKIELTKEFCDMPIAHANEFALQEMLISLLSNAREAVKDKAIKQIGIKTWQYEHQVGFCVEDSGEGIAEEQKNKLFTPFLSSKNEGMGLGLYFCREIAKDLDGSIEYYPATIGGAGFKTTLPKQQDTQNGTTI